MASAVAHLTGLLFGIRLQIQLGATGVYQDVWSNERFVQLIEQHRITITRWHPLGASGARIALSAAIELHDRNARRALATMCIGVGQGMSPLLESP